MPKKHLLLLLLWLAIATGLRLTQLTAKPPWTDEFSTMVFSLGNSFRTVPLNQVIPLEVLMQPLQPNPQAGVVDVIQHLVTQSNHPPLYFMLAHGWMHLWPPELGNWGSLWGARSLSAILGAISIPAIYAISWLAFRSHLTSQMVAAICAVSPYGIFIAQEARHYTLGILWIIASLGCLAVATRCIERGTVLPIWVAIVWILVNFLGVSTHYFFVLTLCGEALWLLVLCCREFKVFIEPQRRRGRREGMEVFAQERKKVGFPYVWRQICAIALATMLGCLVWLPVYLQGSNRSELSEWIQSSDRTLIQWISPVFQALATGLTMLYLLPVSVDSLAVVIVSGLAMLGFLIWVVPILKRGFGILLVQPATSLMTQMFIALVLSAIALFFFFTYILGIDLTRGARYNFVYFPAAIILLGASLAVCWHSPNQEKKVIPSMGKVPVILIWFMGLVSGLIVVNNLGYPKYYRPDLLVPVMQQVSQSPMLIATTHKTHVQIGEMMGLARVFKRSGSASMPLFLLADQEQNPSDATLTLQQSLTMLPRPLDLWLVNFHAPAKLDQCKVEPKSFPLVYGYDYQLYRCP